MKKCLKFVSVVLSIMLAFGCVSLPVLADDTAQTSAFDEEFEANYQKIGGIYSETGGFATNINLGVEGWDENAYKSVIPSNRAETSSEKSFIPSGEKAIGFNFGSSVTMPSSGVLFTNGELWWDYLAYIVGDKDAFAKVSLYIESDTTDKNGKTVTTQVSPLNFFLKFNEKSNWATSDKCVIEGLSVNEWHDVYLPLSAFNLEAKNLSIVVDKDSNKGATNLYGLILGTEKATDIDNYKVYVKHLAFYKRNMALNEVTVADGKANLSWKNSVPPEKGTVAAYKVYRDGSLLTTINDVNTLAYTDTTATTDDVHEYYVDAVDANGASLAASNKRYPVVYGKDTVKKVLIYTNTGSGAMQPKWDNNADRIPKYLKRADDSMAIPEGEMALGMQWIDISKWNAQALIPTSGTIDLSKVNQNGYLTFKMYLDTTVKDQWQTPIDSLKIGVASKDWLTSASYDIPVSVITNDKWQYVMIPMSAFSALNSTELQEISFSFPENQGYKYKLYVQDIAFTMPKVNRDETEVKDGNSTATTIEKGKTYSANITAYNHSDAAVTPTFVAALYNGNALADVAVISDQAISADGEHTFTHSFAVPNEDGNYEIKAFLFDDFNNLTPYPFVK